MAKKKFSVKLYISFAVMFLLVIFSAIYCVYMNNKTQYYANDVASNWFPSINAHGKLMNDFLIASNKAIYIISHKLDGNYSIEADKEDLLKNQNTFFENLEKYKKDLMTVGMEEATTEEVYKTWKNYKDNLNIDLSMLEKNPHEAYKHFNLETKKSASLVAQAIFNEIEFNFTHGIEATKQGDYLTALTNITMAVLILISVITAVIVFLIIQRTTTSISTSVNNLKKQSVSTNEIASSLKMSSEKLLSSIDEQSAAVHETSAAINEITSMVNRTAENTKESTDISKAASGIAEDGQKIMQRLGHAMETIQESSSQLQKIAEIIGQINSKTAVINDIVSKTELLSLNASIESARAGEYGKGFAVVAEEVGNLAKISGNAAHEIQALITSSQEQVDTILNLTKDRVNEGKNVTTDAQSSFSNISENIEKLSGIINYISDATREQETGVKQIAQAMTQIEKSTHSSQESVGITSNSAKKLFEEVEMLNNTVKIIEVLMNGQTEN